MDTDSEESVPVRRNGLIVWRLFGSNGGTVPNNFGTLCVPDLGVVCLFTIPGIKPSCLSGPFARMKSLHKDSG